MFFFEWQSKPVDDGAQYLKKLRDSVEAFGLINELEEDIVDRATYVRTEIKEFAVYTVESSLEKVAFAGVFRIKQVQ